MHRIHALILSTCALAGCQFDYAPCDGPGETSSSSTIDKACPEDAICFDVNPLDGKTVREGHVVVMWSQLNEVDPDPAPEIAFDTRIDASSRRVVIPSREVRPPKDQALLLCERACTDEARCLCTGDIAVGTATVLVVDDSNKDGRIDAKEATTAAFGRGETVIVRSEKEYRPAPAPFNAVFSDAILRGVHGYRIIDDGGDVRLGSPEEGQAFELSLCPAPGRDCNLPAPKLRAF